MGDQKYTLEEMQEYADGLAHSHGLNKGSTIQLYGIIDPRSLNDKSKNLLARTAKTLRSLEIAGGEHNFAVQHLNPGKKRHPGRRTASVVCTRRGSQTTRVRRSYGE